MCFFFTLPSFRSRSFPLSFFSIPYCVLLYSLSFISLNSPSSILPLLPSFRPPSPIFLLSSSFSFSLLFLHFKFHPLLYSPYLHSFSSPFLRFPSSPFLHSPSFLFFSLSLCFFSLPFFLVPPRQSVYSDTLKEAIKKNVGSCSRATLLNVKKNKQRIKN